MGVGVGTGNATEPPEKRWWRALARCADGGAAATVPWQGTPPEGEYCTEPSGGGRGEGRWRTEAGRGSQEAAPCQSREMSLIFTAQPSRQRPGSRLLAAAAISDEPQGRQGVATKEFRFLCWGWATAGWVQSLPLGGGAGGEPGKGHEFATHYK